MEIVSPGLVKCCHWHDSVDGVSFAHITEQIQTELTKLTRDRGNAILKRKGHTSYGVATVVAQLVDAILRDESGCLQFPQPIRLWRGNEVLGPCIMGMALKAASCCREMRSSNADLKLLP